MTKRLLLAAFLMGLTFSAWAQQAAIGNSLVGTIGLLDLDEYKVTISGRQYGYDESMFKVFYDGEEMPYTILDEGLVVRFYINTNDVVTRLELLGPIDRIRSFFDS
jgi:hypothetical protein